MPTNRPALILDADGVILNWFKGYVEFVEARRGVSRASCLSTEPHFDMRTVFPMLTREERIGLIKEFAMSPAFGQIEIEAAALEMVSELRRRDPGLPVHCVTAPGDHPETIARRVRNLEPFGFDHIEVLPLGASKGDVLARYPAASVVVDDQFEHVETADGLGHVGVLMHQSYNAHVDAPRRLGCWNKILDLSCDVLSLPQAA